MCCVKLDMNIMAFFFFKQKTAYEMRISDWSSDVCSSDLPDVEARWRATHAVRRLARFGEDKLLDHIVALAKADSPSPFLTRGFPLYFHFARQQRSEEHTSELQSLMRISYAVFCLKKKKIL